MKHTITINQENTTEHIIHLDQHLPININPLPRHIAYKIQDTPIITTTTRTLQKETITSIRQKAKQITTPTHLILIQNGHNHNIKLQTETMQRNNTYCIKLNQKTIHTSKLKNGILEATIPLNYKPRTYTLTIKTGNNPYYNGLTKNTKLTITQ